MKLMHLLGAASLALAVGCASEQSGISDHWSASSIGPRVGRSFLGYDHHTDGASYLDFQWRRKQESSLTVRRHFLNQNPHNPFQTESSDYPRERPKNSILPEPWTYIHFTLFDGLIATYDEGGMEEFYGGIEDTFGPVSVVISALLYDGLGIPDAEEQAQAKQAAQK